ncbi:TPA: hypothetical protein ACF9CH_002837 [Staphylococcus aureus]|nr:hypothetical protein [Staphylococcus aureus]
MNYYKEEKQESILKAINVYEFRNSKKKTNSISRNSVINLASGIVVIDGTAQSISVNLKLSDLKIVKESTCKKCCKSEIIRFENERDLIIFLLEVHKEHLLYGNDIRGCHYA